MLIAPPPFPFSPPPPSLVNSLVDLNRELIGMMDAIKFVTMRIDPVSVPIGCSEVGGKWVESGWGEGGKRRQNAASGGGKKFQVN